MDFKWCKFVLKLNVMSFTEIAIQARRPSGVLRAEKDLNGQYQWQITFWETRKKRLCPSLSAAVEIQALSGDKSCVAH